MVIGGFSLPGNYAVVTQPEQLKYELFWAESEIVCLETKMSHSDSAKIAVNTLLPSYVEYHGRFKLEYIIVDYATEWIAFWI